MTSPVCVGLTECGVRVGGEPDPCMKGWRFYRVEYGGANESCVHESHIWLPPNVDPDAIERIIEDAQ